MNGALPYLALTMGLMSSFHCIGMCGPIALALPVQGGNRIQQLFGLSLYNGGRALSYALLGTAVGSIGSSLAWIGYLRYLSIFAGAVMLVYVIWPAGADHFLHPPVFWKKAVQLIRKRMSAVLHSRKMHSWLLLGILNGLLPCGMVYLALISSVASGTISGGAIYMLLFGIGTLPVMMAVGFFKNWFSPLIRSRVRKFTPVLMAVAGIWLIARGVFIAYPSQNAGPAAQITICHGR